MRKPTAAERNKARRERSLNQRRQSPPPIFGPDRLTETPDPWDLLACGEHSDYDNYDNDY